MDDFYEQVYSQDNPNGESSGWIQWKGTYVCIDLNCKCGHHGHVDAEFFYFYECPVCHTKYAVGQNVKLISLTEDQAKHAAENHCGFTSCELDDDI